MMEKEEEREEKEGNKKRAMHVVAQHWEKWMKISSEEKKTVYENMICENK